MTQDEFFTSHLSATPVIAILRGFPPDKAVELANLAWNAHIPLVEVPIQNDAGRQALEAVASRAHELGVPIGAGTVLTNQDVDFAKSVGCAFTVAPGLDEGVCLHAVESGLHHLPGVATATEVARAQSLGLSWQKAFPARELGTGWFSSIRGPFPNVKFVATGGVDATNLGLFLDAGASAVGVGTFFTDPKFLNTINRFKRTVTS